MNNFNVGDRIKTNVWVNSPDRFLNDEFDEGEIFKIEPDETLFHKILQREERIIGNIWVKFNDGRVLPCYKEELIKI